MALPMVVTICAVLLPSILDGGPSLLLRRINAALPYRDSALGSAGIWPTE
jgi:hypothetical protein